MKLTFILFFLIFCESCKKQPKLVFTSKTHKPIEATKVSIDQLNKNPSTYHKKYIELSGFFHSEMVGSEFELIGIFNGTKSDSTLRCVLLDNTESLLDSIAYQKLEKKKVCVTGFFDSVMNWTKEIFYKGTLDSISLIKEL